MHNKERFVLCEAGNNFSFLSFTGMKNRELLAASPGRVCPLADQPVCLCSAHRRREKKDRLKIN